MRRALFRREMIAVVLVLLAGPAATVQGQDFLARSEFLIEGGIAFPGGDLGGSFEDTETGLGAGNGYLAGLKYRQRFGGNLRFEFAFQFLQFGSYVLQPATEEDEETEFLGTMLRFNLGATHLAGREGQTVRPLLGAAFSLAKNNFQIEYRDSEEQYEASAWSPGLLFTAGLRIKSFEFLVAWHYNRFSTPRFFYTGDDETYDWSSLAVTASYRLPGG